MPEEPTIARQGVPRYDADDKVWVDYLTTLKKEGTAAMRPYYAEWASNEAYLRGGEEQFHQASFPEGKIRMLKPSRWGTKVAFNQIDQLFWTQMDRLFSRRPAFQVMPITNSLQDRTAAKTGKRGLDYYWDHRLAVTLRLLQAGYHSLICGRGPIACEVQQTGEELELEAKGIIGKAKQAIMGKEKIPKVRLSLRTVNPRNILVDWLAADFHDEPRAQWSLEWRPTDVDLLKARTGYKKDLNPDPFAGQGGTAEEGALVMGGNVRWEQAPVKNAALEHVYRHLPVPGVIPDGVEIVMAGGKILSKNIFPGYGPPGEKRLPYAAMAYRPPIEGFWVKNYVKDLKGPQRWRNEMMEYYLARMKRTVGTIFYRRGFFANKADEQELMLDVHKPVEVVGDQSGIWVPNLEGSTGTLERGIAMMKGEMEDLGGAHKVSKGQAEFAGMPASLGALLQQADQSQFGPVVLLNEVLCYQPLAMLILYHLAEYHTEREVFADIEVPEDSARVFEGALLGRGRFDVRVEPGSTFPVNEEREKVQIVDEWGKGLYGPIGDPDVRRSVLRSLKRTDPLAESDAGAVQEEIIKRENAQLRKGKTLPINLYDDHGQHYRDHLQDWARSGMDNPNDADRDAAYKVHVDQHGIKIGKAPSAVPGGRTQATPEASAAAAQMGAAMPLKPEEIPPAPATGAGPEEAIGQ